MDLVAIVFVLIVVAVVLAKVPMDGDLRNLIVLLVVLAVVYWCFVTFAPAIRAAIH